MQPVTLIFILKVKIPERQLGIGESEMAAQLKDGGRYPSIQKLRQADFERLAAACQNPKAPSQGFRDIVKKALVAKPLGA